MIWIILGGFCAIFYGVKLTHLPVSHQRTAVKTSATLGLCVAGVVLGAPWILICGLLLGALGDAFLSRDHSIGFLPGLGAFLCGHLIYLYWALEQIQAAPDGMIHIFASALLIVIGAMLFKRWWPQLGALKLPVLLYGIISICLAISAFVFLGLGIGTLFAIGVLVFVFSDVLLAEQLFMLARHDPKYPIYASLLWALYWCGQLGILLGSLSFVS